MQSRVLRKDMKESAMGFGSIGLSYSSCTNEQKVIQPIQKSAE